MPAAMLSVRFILTGQYHPGLILAIGEGERLADIDSPKAKDDAMPRSLCYSRKGGGTMEQSVEAFWENFERETGEKSSGENDESAFRIAEGQRRLGLLVLSAAGIRFRKTPGENWFASLSGLPRLPYPGKTKKTSSYPFRRSSRFQARRRNFSILSSEALSRPSESNSREAA